MQRIPPDQSEYVYDPGNGAIAAPASSLEPLADR